MLCTYHHAEFGGMPPSRCSGFGFAWKKLCDKAAHKLTSLLLTSTDGLLNWSPLILTVLHVFRGFEQTHTEFMAGTYFQLRLSTQRQCQAATILSWLLLFDSFREDMLHLWPEYLFIFAIGPHALAILHRMTARTAFPFAGRSRPNPSGELESQQVLLTWQTLTIAQRIKKRLSSANGWASFSCRVAIAELHRTVRKSVLRLLWGQNPCWLYNLRLSTTWKPRPKPPWK